MSEEFDNRDGGEMVIERAPEKEKLKEPPKWAVVMLNDDYTPMEFVVELLVRIFRKSADEAEAIMWDVHKKGKGIAGVYTKDIAETKVVQANTIAQQAKHPFRCELEQA